MFLQYKMWEKYYVAISDLGFRHVSSNFGLTSPRLECYR